MKLKQYSWSTKLNKIVGFTTNGALKHHYFIASTKLWQWWQPPLKEHYNKPKLFLFLYMRTINGIINGDVIRIINLLLTWLININILIENVLLIIYRERRINKYTTWDCEKKIWFWVGKKKSGISLFCCGDGNLNLLYWFIKKIKYKYYY